MHESYANAPPFIQGLEHFQTLVSVGVLEAIPHATRGWLHYHIWRWRHILSGTKENWTLLFIKTVLFQAVAMLPGGVNTEVHPTDPREHQRCKVGFVSMFLSLKPVWRPAFPRHLSTPSQLLRGTAHSDEDGNCETKTGQQKSESRRPISQGPAKRQNSHQLLL